ncbi:MAG: hypothetical protein U0931_18250 [Vulcanimicrobiota bacterium]
MMETVLGAFILWFVVLSIALLFQGSIFIMERASCSVQAGSLAEAAIDQLRAQGFRKLTLGSSDLPDTTAEGVVYKTHLEVFVPPDEPPASRDNLRGIRATVSWTLRGRNLTLVRESWMSCVRS